MEQHSLQFLATGEIMVIVYDIHALRAQAMQRPAELNVLSKCQISFCQEAEGLRSFFGKKANKMYLFFKGLN